jgi:uncharacterized protein (UPF0305 family)
MASTLDILTEHNSSHWCHSQAWVICSRDSRSNNYILHPIFEVVTLYVVFVKKNPVNTAYPSGPCPAQAK